jgi:HEPN domain-containing protein
MSQSKSRHESERWWFTAKDDLEAAKILHKAGKYSHVCFLSQQSAEKAVKALWFSIDSDPWGHSIQKLVMDFPRKNMFQSIDNWLANAAYLDKYYIPAQYPNGLPDLTPSQIYFLPDSEQAIKKAEFFLEQTQQFFKSM